MLEWFLLGDKKHTSLNQPIDSGCFLSSIRVQAHCWSINTRGIMGIMPHSDHHNKTMDSHRRAFKILFTT